MAKAHDAHNRVMKKRGDISLFSLGALFWAFDGDKKLCYKLLTNSEANEVLDSGCS